MIEHKKEPSHIQIQIDEYKKKYENYEKINSRISQIANEAKILAQELQESRENRDIMQKEMRRDLHQIMLAVMEYTSMPNPQLPCKDYLPHEVIEKDAQGLLEQIMRKM